MGTISFACWSERAVSDEAIDFSRNMMCSSMGSTHSNPCGEAVSMPRFANWIADLGPLRLFFGLRRPRKAESAPGSESRATQTQFQRFDDELCGLSMDLRAYREMPPKDDEQQSIEGETNTMRPFLAVLLICGAFGLVGCMDTTATDTVAATGGDLTGATATNCREAIARETNRSLGDVVIFDVLESEAGNQAQASIAGADQPWICMTDRNGVVIQVMYPGQG